MLDAAAFPAALMAWDPNHLPGGASRRLIRTREAALEVSRRVSGPPFCRLRAPRVHAGAWGGPEGVERGEPRALAGAGGP